MSVLVVEDEAIVADDLRRKLEKIGYTVVGIASSGLEAIRKTEQSAPDLVLMDVRLKGEMTGWEAASQIRSRRDIPIVFLTAYPGLLKEGVQPGMIYRYLSKPYSWAQLKGVLDEISNRSGEAI
jgi:CheY-like chemotaxis protein